MEHCRDCKKFIRKKDGRCGGIKGSCILHKYDLRYGSYPACKKFFIKGEMPLSSRIFYAKDSMGERGV
ncbi:MAG: hypothetical protein J5725_00435 [Bacteroidales bacterium]|nr:hypothetical protein [Bacteroidales bacterium]